jgi:hypothetical protein
MTTGQTMLALGRSPLWAVLLALALLPCACAPKTPDLVRPATLAAPYDAARGEVLWAVVPLRNESGTTLADSFAVSDKVVAAAAQVRGVRTLPLNRTIATMRTLGITHLESPADAKRLATEMGADGIIVGSITAYDPYDPPRLGLALALYSRTPVMDFAGDQTIDTRTLQFQPTDYQYFPRSSFGEAPASVAAQHLDAKNHQVLADVRAYAQGRHDPKSAYGWRRYTASMDLFTEFAAWHTVSRLLDHEWIRLSNARRAQR